MRGDFAGGTPEVNDVNPLSHLAMVFDSQCCDHYTLSSVRHQNILLVLNAKKEVTVSVEQGGGRSATCATLSGICLGILGRRTQVLRLMLSVELNVLR